MGFRFIRYTEGEMLWGKKHFTFRDTFKISGLEEEKITKPLSFEYRCLLSLYSQTKTGTS